MVPFRGTFDHTLDAKNRLTVPARYRAALADGRRAGDARGPQAVRRRLAPGGVRGASRAPRSPSSRRCPRAAAELERYFYGNSADAELDAAGRIMIPPSLRESARLAKDVIVVGVGDRLELWDKAAWNDHRTALLSGVAEATARVDDAA